MRQKTDTEINRSGPRPFAHPQILSISCGRRAVDVARTYPFGLARGEEFAIVEHNGTGAEMTHIWDNRTTLVEPLRTLCMQFSLLFRIGAANRRRGARPERWRNSFRQWRRERQLETGELEVVLLDDQLIPMSIHAILPSGGFVSARTRASRAFSRRICQ